jgi:superfamily I DNA/RNA helicase
MDALDGYRSVTGLAPQFWRAPDRRTEMRAVGTLIKERPNPDRYRQEEQRARSLVFVAATRARDELVVTWSGKASRFLPPDADDTAFRATDLLRKDAPASGSSESSAA